MLSYLQMIRHYSQFLKIPIPLQNDMNHDLELIRKWAHNWRMSFNPDPQKQAVELIFSRKRIETDHPVFILTTYL